MKGVVSKIIDNYKVVVEDMGKLMNILGDDLNAALEKVKEMYNNV